MQKRISLTTQVVIVLACCVALAPAVFAQVTKAAGKKSGFVTTADGVKIHYLEAGPNPGTTKGPALLFVPGWTMPAEIWEKQIAHLAKTHWVVAMDPRSQGLSSQTTEGHYPAARARDIKAVVDQLKLAPACPGSSCGVVLVGWSMGVTDVFGNGHRNMDSRAWMD